MAKSAVFERSAEELAGWLTERGQPGYRARQIREGIARRRVVRFADMTDLPRPLRDDLERDWKVFDSEIALDRRDDDRTRKVLVKLEDGQTIEAVLLFEEERRTVCLSTQVGCGMGCVFCASGLNGVARNLSAGEMIEELLLLRNLLPAEERLSHIVVMGMGEPLANLDRLLTALEFATSKDGLGISARHITISTVGLVGRMRQLAEAGRPYHLAVSLHAPNDELRQRIVPTAEKLPMTEIVAAADEYRAKSGRQVTFEYVLLGGVNDAPEHARQLGKLLAGRDAMLNLIPWNPVAGMPWETPSSERSRRFADLLREAGVVVKTRKRKGAAIDAACGQLRREALGTADEPIGIGPMKR